MAYVRIETSVARNRKFVKAGPAPSWLWVCGLAYCQEGLTDGFIPSEALNYLGVKNARQLANHLVTAGLWDVADGGWHVHDYLEHNRSASHVNDLKDRRKEGGKLGGRPRINLQETSKVIPRETFPVAVVDAAAVVEVVQERKKGDPPPCDVWFQQLKQMYPEQRVTSGHLTETAFVEVILGAADGPDAAFARMLANLENQIRGHEWRVKGYIPKLENWLKSGAWEQRHEEAAPVAEQLATKTSRTAQAVAEIMREGQ